MLLRRIDADRVIAFSQPCHAWLAGELARAWGGGGFTVPQPRGAVLCGTALHDIGWLEWETAPVFDETTGLPLQFFGVPAEQHTQLWRRGIEHARIYGLLPALLVSRHGDAIYERTFDPATARPEAAAAVRAFREEQAAFQRAAIARLAADPATADAVTDRSLGFSKDFIAAVDTMSLHLCWGIKEPVTIHDVPDAPRGSLALAQRADGMIAVDPWPFVGDSLDLMIEGRRLDGASADQDALDAALGEAPPARVSLTLRPG